MKELNLIVVGQLKDQNLLALEEHYLKQIKAFKLNIHEIKSQKEDVTIEASLVLKKIDQLNPNSKGMVILLSEKGKQMDSVSFSRWLYNHFEKTAGSLFLIIGGSTGFGEDLLSKSNEKISLSMLTFPHKMARLILIEQLYRAQTINTNHPYHK